MSKNNNCDACKCGLDFANGLDKVHECRNYGKPVAGHVKTINREISVAELQLGDVVKTSGGGNPFDTAVVCNVTDTEVTLFRPYATTSDFSYTGGVIPYIGIEEFKIARASFPTLFVYSRKVVV